MLHQAAISLFVNFVSFCSRRIGIGRIAGAGCRSDLGTEANEDFGQASTGPLRARAVPAFLPSSWRLSAGACSLTVYFARGDRGHLQTNRLTIFFRDVRCVPWLEAPLIPRLNRRSFLDLSV